MSQLNKAIAILEKGGIVIFPTETVLGIGCLLNFPESIERLYKIKKRDRTKPTLVLVKSLADAQKLVKFSKTAEALAKHFWPGPLTISQPNAKNVPEQLLGPSRSLAIRIPSHTWLLSLLKILGQPLLAPSANFQNKPPAKKLAEIDKELAKLVDYEIDIEPGGNEPSTVVFVDNGGDYKIIREGPISKKAIEQVISVTEVKSGVKQ